MRLRDKGDEIAKIIQTYAESETINRSLSNGLTNFSTTLSVIGDYRYIYIFIKLNKYK